MTESTIPKLDSKNIFESDGPENNSVLSWKGLEYVEIKILNKNRITDVENKLMVARGERGREGINWEMGIDTYTLLYIIDN